MNDVEYIDERDLNVFIDGSSLSSPRRGGVGIVFVTEGPDGHWAEEPYEVGGIAGATNNQMEIQACMDALQAIMRGRARADVANYRRVVFWTDSQYLVSRTASSLCKSGMLWHAPNRTSQSGVGVDRAGA